MVKRNEYKRSILNMSNNEKIKTISHDGILKKQFVVDFIQRKINREKKRLSMGR
jgi:hypothetical protein